MGDIIIGHAIYLNPNEESIDYERRAVFESIAKQFPYNYHGLKAEQSNIPSALDRPPGVEKAFSLNKTLILTPSWV